MGHIHHSTEASFIPGFTRFQTNLLGFICGTMLFILLVFINWILLLRDRERKLKRRYAAVRKTESKKSDVEIDNASNSTYFSNNSDLTTALIRK